MEMKYDIFISYSTKDREKVQYFVNDLRKQGYNLWMDKDGIRSGDPSFKKTLVNAIENSQLVLFFSSCNSNNSDWTAKEIGIAVEEHKYIIPLKLDSTQYSESVRYDLVNCDFIDYSSERYKKTALEKLYSSLESRLGRSASKERHVNVNKELLQLAELYRKGDGVPRDFSFAATIYRKVADQGNPLAQCNLASLYAKGLGVKRDYNIAITLYKMASAGGSSLATFKLGELYFDGEHLPMDYNKAILLFQQSAAMGCCQAKEKLKTLGMDY